MNKKIGLVHQIRTWLHSSAGSYRHFSPVKPIPEDRLKTRFRGLGPSGKQATGLGIKYVLGQTELPEPTLLAYLEYEAGNGLTALGRIPRDKMFRKDLWHA